MPGRVFRPRSIAELTSEETSGHEAGGLILPPDYPVSAFIREFFKNKGAVIGGLFIFVIILIALFANVLAPYSPIEQFRDVILLPPFWENGGDWLYPLGTDDLGRDILSRLVHGAQFSLFVGLMVVTLSLFFGIALGLLAGFYRGSVESIIMRMMDIMLAIPSLLLAIAIVAILGPSLINAIMAIVIVNLPHYVRLTRSSVISEAKKDYVTASKVAGASDLRLMTITILPNCMAPLIVQATLGFSSAILDAAALGFLGLGAQPPTPEWGSMLANAMQFVQSAWWVVTFPGLAILFTVLAFNLMGDGLRDTLDPKMKI